jgi:DNA-binding transcriptional MerR regulator
MPAPTGYPPPPAHAPYVTTEQLEKIMREREEKSELVKLKERMEKMDRDFAGALTSLKEDILKSIEERQPAGVPYEEVKEFIDEEGKVCRPDKAASVRIKRIPITAREPAEVKELREELRDLQKMLQDREISSLREEIKGLKEEIPKRREVEVKPVTPEEVQKAVAEASAKAAQTVLAEVKKEDKEERRHLELLDAIQRSSGAKVVEGYKQDAYRFLGQGMGEVARVIEKKEPIKIIIQGAERLLAGPPPKEVEEGAREGILSRLPPEWVAEE